MSIFFSIILFNYSVLNPTQTSDSIKIVYSLQWIRFFYIILTNLIWHNRQTSLSVYKSQNHLSSTAAFLLCEETKGKALCVSLIWCDEDGETLSSSKYWHNYNQHINVITKGHQSDIMITGMKTSIHPSILDT